MNLSDINAAMQAAYDAALVNPVKQAPAQVGADPNQTVQVVVYEAPEGAGFRVVGRVRVPNPNNETGPGADFVATRVMNHGPDVGSVRDWPADVDAAAEAYFAARAAQVLSRNIRAGERFVEASGFSGSRLVTLMDTLIAVKEADGLAGRPKLVALYEWLQTVKGMAVAGNVAFPAAPHSFEEVITEGV